MKKAYVRTALLCAALLAAFAAGAQPAARVAPNVTGPAQPVAPVPAPAPPAGRWTLAQLQEAFTLADSDNNQQLTRAESQQLVILPRSFEDLDQNKDGVLTRPEYEAILG
jgi:hypothetical protein